MLDSSGAVDFGTGGSNCCLGGLPSLRIVVSRLFSKNMVGRIMFVNVAVLFLISECVAYSFFMPRFGNNRSFLFAAPHQTTCSAMSRFHRGTMSLQNRRIYSIVLQSSIGIDSSTQLPASERHDKSSDTTLVGLNDEEDKNALYSYKPLEASAVTLHEEDSGDIADPLIVDPKTEIDDVAKTIFNGLLLSLSFGFAAYTILNIDAGMTRGWTQSEIAVRIPLDNWLNYENSLADRPVVTKTAINVIIYLLGDWLSQTVFARKNLLDFDAVRTLRNGFIGLCFGPLVVQYYQFSDHILPVEGGMWNRLEKILMDQTVYLTIKCSIYIAAVGLLQGDSPTAVKANVQTKLPNIVVTAWKFWPLIHLVTYGVIPARHRILWVNCVDLIWNAILAGMTTKTVEQPQPVLVDDTFLVATTPSERSIPGEQAKSLLVKSHSNSTMTTILSNEEDPFVLHQDIVYTDFHPVSLFDEDSKNQTAIETTLF